jgi:Tfp pilus assembly protein PilX
MNVLRNAKNDERGFSMVAVMLVMLVAGLFATGAFAMANGDIPLAKGSQDRKEAYAAARAGVDFYAFHLAQDNRYWVHCTNVPAPNATEPSPVVNKYYGTGTDPRTNRWRTVPGTNAQYVIELLPAKAPTASTPQPQCVEDDESSMLDPSTGMFRIRVTGRKGNVRRSVIATFRRNSLLDFLWLTNFETQDPNNYPPSGYPDPEDYKTPGWAATNCDDYRGTRSSGCKDQQFASADNLAGPFHTNDTIWTCDGSTFGRPGRKDKLEVSGPSPGWDNRCGTSSPTFNAPFLTGQPTIDIPLSNSSLATVAASGGSVYTGVTRIRLDGTQMYVNGSTTATALPANGVIYVKSGAGGCGTTPAVLADYVDLSSCGNVYVSGTYGKNLTIASDNDVIIAPTASSAPGDANLQRQSGTDAVLGLIATNFVRVSHRVSRTATQAGDPTACTNVDTTANPNLGNITIQAAILSVKHSFTVDNYGCGAPEGNLTVKGAIAQFYRGTVGATYSNRTTSWTTGYIKNYVYDDLLKFRTPPYFLEPISAPWRVVRINEQVPAT